MHLLQSGVDLTTIQSWLGHASPNTTHHYVEADLEMKRRALEKCVVPDTPHYWVFRSDWGNWAFFRDTRATSGLVNGLSPNTTYAFQAKARDKLNQMSALSAPVMVTTGPVDQSDTTPPTTPTNLQESHYDQEMNVSWGEFTDNVDPQDAIRYEVYVNGELADLVFGTGFSISYGVRHRGVRDRRGREQVGAGEDRDGDLTHGASADRPQAGATAAQRTPAARPRLWATTASR